jgi:hypothetical protein
VLVIGTGKSGFIHGRVYGARGLQIVVSVPCDVAVVPQVDLHFRSGVVAGLDRHETAALIARAAAAEAAARAEPLLLLHASFEDPGARRGSDTVIDIGIAAVLATWPNVLVRARRTQRPAAEALLDASRTAALMVLGPGSMNAGSPVGTVLHDVLVNINVPVLVARR